MKNQTEKWKQNFCQKVYTYKVIDNNIEGHDYAW
jgi:hypothetical protein